MGFLLGKQWQPRDLAKLCYDNGWTEAVNLVTIIAVCLSESQGYQGAYNDNKDADGNVLSRDCGLFQINIPALKIGSDEEKKLFADPDYNVQRARTLFEARGFDPWYAYKLNVYLRDSYIKRAVRGVGNFIGDELLKRAPTDTLSGAPYTHTLETPLLDYEYRVELLDGACSRVVQMARDLKVHTDAANDARIDEIIRVASTARSDAKK
jgi:hypothetical protein